MSKKNQQIILVFEGIRYLVKDINFGYKQRSDKTGRPSSTVRHSNITLLLVAQGKSIDREMLEHFADRRTFNGHIEFLIVDNGIENKISGDLEFANAKFKNWGESNHYEGFDGEELMRVVIHPLIVRYQGVVTELPRNPSNPFAVRTAPVTVREDTTKQLTAYTLTDETGKTISEYDTGQTIILHIKTENRTGDTVTIHLNDSEHDFKHNGVFLENDTLQDISITSNHMEIELEVTDQRATENENTTPPQKPKRTPKTTDDDKI